MSLIEKEDLFSFRKTFASGEGLEGGTDIDSTPQSTRELGDGQPLDDVKINIQDLNEMLLHVSPPKMPHNKIESIL